MPTFLILRKDAVVKTIRGANPNALQSAVSDIAKQSAASNFSSSTGHVLGTSEPLPRRTGPQQAYSRDGLMATIIRFIMLYTTTLFSLDPVAAAQSSPYSKIQR